ncbi:MAG: hypothetical protein Q9226_005001 [Calogaya cf. arnoldii]
MPDTSAVTAPLVEQLNPAAAFVGSLGKDFHPALPAPNVAFDSEVDNFREKRLIQRDRTYRAAREERDILLASIKAYKKQDKDHSHPHLGIISDWDWQAVMDEILKAERSIDVEGSEGILGAIRKCARKLGKSGEAFIYWLKMLPDDAYGSIICGGFQLIIKAAVRHRVLCERVLDALAAIPEAIREAKFAKEQYESEELEGRIADLYQSISQCLHRILEFYKRRSPGRFSKMIWKATKAIAKGPDYGSEIELDIQAVKDSAKLVKNEEQRCHQLLTARIEMKQDCLTLQNADFKDLATENVEIVKNVQETLNILKNMYASASCALKDDRITQEEKHQQEREPTPRYSSQVNRAWERISQAVTPEPVRREGPSIQQLVHVLGTSPKTIAQDLQWIFQDSRSFSVSRKAQASLLMANQKFREWFTSAKCYCLFAQGDISDNSPVSALSLVSGLLIQTSHSWTTALPLLYTCGLHTDQRRDAHPNAKGMLQSLIVQLLLAPQYQNSSLDFVDHALFGNLQNTDLPALCAVFEGLLHQLPQKAIVVLVVDGVSFYETEDRPLYSSDA